MSPDHCSYSDMASSTIALGHRWISRFWPSGAFGWIPIAAAHEMEQRMLALICSLHLLFVVAAVHAEPGYDHSNRNGELETVDSIIDVEATDPIEHGAPEKPLRNNNPSARYADYDYYANGRRLNENGPGTDNDLSASSAIREHNYRRPADEITAKPLPWYGPYSGKSIAMYPSRSYDPYIRRYDRFDEQYHRAYPQYFEDMYVHRQRFDPYDSYSPRVPQYPEPYLMYPDRQLDTPPARDYYVKSRRDYIDDIHPMSSLDSYSNQNKYAPSKLPHQLVSPRHERVVYYAHLPEIVRTPYDVGVARTDRNGAAALVAERVPFKPNKKKLKSQPRADNSTNYKQMF